MRSLLLFVLIATSASAEDWVGKKFLPRVGVKFMQGGREVEPESLAFPLTVIAVDGEWLLFDAVRAKKMDVVPLENATAYYTQYLQRNPRAGWAFHYRGIAWHACQQLDEAIKDYTYAIQLDPNDSSSYNTRGAAYYDKGDLDIALKDFDEAIRLDSSSGATFRNRGITRQTKGDLAGALEDYTDAIRLDPRDQDSLNGRAWIQGTSRDARFFRPQNAVADATKACELSKWNHDGHLDTLAAAYAAAGDFKRAIEWQEKAISLAPADGKADFESRLQLYRTGKPFRE
jgi:tetratricopeptide (TPR) repeat protein